MNFQIGIEDTVNNTISYICDFNISSGVGPINESGYLQPIYIDENCRLIYNGTKISGSYGSYTVEALLVRVR